jgi:hypothetical protein
MNIKCAVKKMEDYMKQPGASLKKHASKYWSPFKTANYKKRGRGESLVTGVGKACDMSRGIANDGSGGSMENVRVHWPTENWTPTKGKGLATTNNVGGAPTTYTQYGAR